ncbi:MAG: hypothetical protein AB4352_17600 [Hormoscilla sp.]
MELNVDLVKDEVVISKHKFSYGLLLFFVKSHFWLTNKRFIAHYPNFVAWIIPVGGSTVTYPLKQIQSVLAEKSFKIFAPLFWGVFWLIVGMGTLEIGVGLLFILISILNFANILRTYILVMSGGSKTKYKYVPWESGNAKKMVEQLNGLIAEI